MPSEFEKLLICRDKLLASCTELCDTKKCMYTKSARVWTETLLCQLCIHPNGVHVHRQCACTKTSSTKVAAGLERFVRLASNDMTIIISMRTTK